MQYTSKIEKNEKAEVTISGELAWKDFDAYRGNALTYLGERTKIDGFRAGKIPADVLVAKLGDMAILNEMSSQAMVDLYTELIKKHELQPIGRPQIQITKLVEGSDMGFTISTSVMPEVQLGDYKKTAATFTGKKIDDTIAKKEIDEALLQLQRMRYQSAWVEENKGKKDAEGNLMLMPKIEDIAKKDLPKIDDDYVQTLGEFKTVDEFMIKLEENMKSEKKSREEEKRRAEMMSAIIEESTIAAPEMLVGYEIDKMMAQTEHDISMAGMDVEEYFKSVDTTRETMRENMHEAAEQRVFMQLVINKIAADEDISPEKKEIDHELEHAKELYKDHKDFDEERARAYFESILLNKSVINWLETQK